MEKSFNSETIVETGRIGPLPIIMHYLKRLHVKEIIDELLPSHALSPVTHGECVIAILFAIFLGKYKLFCVEETLEPYNLTEIFAKPDIKASHFNDTRLGTALDALYGKTEKLYASIVFRALDELKISFERLHLDSTSIYLYGDYDTILEVEASLIKPPPIPNFGKSKDGLSNIKQLLYSLTVTQEGVPLYGRVTNGNQSDVEEFRHHIDKLASMLTDLHKTLLVADSKLCTYQTLNQCVDLGFQIVTLLPENFNIRKTLIEQTSLENELPLLLETSEGEHYHGKSYFLPMKFQLENKEEKSLHLRFLVIHSSQLEKIRNETNQRNKKKERKALEKLVYKYSKESFACMPDAEKIARMIISELKVFWHKLEFKVESFEEKVDKKRGRAKKLDVQKTVTKYRQVLSIVALEETKRTYSPDGMFVLLTSVLEPENMSDKKILESYKGQNVVEMGFNWLKGPLQVAPIFLKLPSRIDVLGFVYLISMFIYALVQRDVRAELAKKGGKLRHPGKRKTEKPTTNGIFRVFESIEIIKLALGEEKQCLLKNFNDDHKRILEIMDWNKLYQFG